MMVGFQKDVFFFFPSVFLAVSVSGGTIYRLLLVFFSPGSECKINPGRDE